MASSAGSCSACDTEMVRRQMSRLPAQVEERATLPLGGDRLLDERRVYSTVEVDDKAPAGAVDQAGAPADLPVAI